MVLLPFRRSGQTLLLGVTKEKKNVNKSYSSGDVAKICNVTPRTIIRWISAGKLAAFKLPGRGNNRIAEDDLIAFLQANAMPVPQDLIKVEERHCIIVGSDKHFIRHVKRIGRDADYVTHVVSDPFEAGLHIASKQPALVVLDEHAFAENAKTTASKIKQTLSQNTEVIVFEDAHISPNKMKDLSSAVVEEEGIYCLYKPLNINLFAQTIEAMQG